MTGLTGQICTRLPCSPPASDSPSRADDTNPGVCVSHLSLPLALLKCPPERGGYYSRRVNIVFVEPSFPRNQRRFVHALRDVGANVIGVGETPEEWLEPEVREAMVGYYKVDNVTDVQQLDAAVRWAQSIAWIDALESTVESHQMAAAQVREWRGIPGTSVRTTWLCRDKPSMKEALRAAGVPTAASTAADSPSEVRRFASRIGYPLILKPRSGAGAQGTVRVNSDEELESALYGFGDIDSIAVEEFVEGHEGFYDTITIDGHVAHDWITHYYPNVLEAMRHRWISPQFITTNRIGDSSMYAEVPMPRAWLTRSPISRISSYIPPPSMRFVAMNCGEIQRLRIASSTLG